MILYNTFILVAVALVLGILREIAPMIFDEGVVFTMDTLGKTALT
jgi:hypothetical protein